MRGNEFRPKNVGVNAIHETAIYYPITHVENMFQTGVVYLNVSYELSKATEANYMCWKRFHKWKDAFSWK